MIKLKPYNYMPFRDSKRTSKLRLRLERQKIVMPKPDYASIDASVSSGNVSGLLTIAINFPLCFFSNKNQKHKQCAKTQNCFGHSPSPPPVPL